MHLSYFFRGKFLLIILIVIISACSVGKHGIRTSKINKMIKNSPVFTGHFTGFALYDPKTKRMIAEHNAAKYFTPASNTKLFTFYTSLQMLGDSVPGLRYSVQNDSLFFQGTGDPSFLHPDLKNTTIYDFLTQRRENLFYIPAIYKGNQYGPGWAWDDFNDYYSAEKSTFPIYGNIVRFQVDEQQKIKTYPHFFNGLVTLANDKPFNHAVIQRHAELNYFTYYQDSLSGPFTQDIPFRQNHLLTLQLLTDTLRKPVTFKNPPTSWDKKILFSIRADSLYKRLMQESDNFIAEQLLLLCSSTLSDTLNTEKAISYATSHLLQDLPDKPVWKDGSGLSRYNLFTPRSIIGLLEKILEVVPTQRLFAILPAGGQSGTIKKWYISESGEPYVFAKTGSLSNVHCLSGYLVTKKGNTLLFSFMHNNYVISINEIRSEMQKVLKELYLNY